MPLASLAILHWVTEARFLSSVYALQQAADSICALSCMQVLMTRHTVMVVGKTSGGKSTVINTLARAQTRMGKRTTLSIMNPKVKCAWQMELQLFQPYLALRCIVNSRKRPAFFSSSR